MILVFGSNGLLGSTLCSLYSKDVIGVSRQECDISHPQEIDRIINKARPDVVINCAGIVKSRKVSEQYQREVNSLSPKFMSFVCDELGIRFIQISTDCVFNGSRGLYTETDVPLPEDYYGVTKLRGEVTTEPHLTVRSSFIGWPDPNYRGLIAWMMSQQGKEVPGYINVRWNGITSVALASYLIEVAYNHNITGLRHIFGEVQRKFDVLEKINLVYELGCKVVPVEEPIKDMTLGTIHNDFPVIVNWDSHLLSQLAYMRDIFYATSD